MEVTRLSSGERPAPPAGSSAQSPPLRGADGKPLRVLIVEDEPFVAFDLEAQILDGGGATRIAPTVAEAERHADEWQPDLILMDIRLPDGDGIDLARTIRRRRRIKLIFVSASTDIETRRRIAELDEAPLIAKPANPELLLATMVRLLASV